MIKKTVIVIAASALACAVWASAASAATRHYSKQHKAHPTAVAKAEPMKAVPGNNPFPIAPPAKPTQNAKAYEQMKGNNPLVNQTAAPAAQNAKAPEGIKGNNPMGVAAK